MGPSRRVRRGLTGGIGGDLGGDGGRDPFDPHLSNRKRLPFGFLFTAAFFFGAVGVADGFVVGPSRREP